MRGRGKRIIDKRIKFKKGFQKKFLIKIKVRSGLTWGSLARNLGLSEYTLREDLQKEKSTMSYNMARYLLKKYPFTEWDVIESLWISEILPKNWGAIKGSKIKRIKHPKNNADLAEIFGVILGDGHLERKTLTITGNANELEHYKYLSKRIKKIFGLESKITFMTRQNSIQLKVHSINLINFLIDNSFQIGNKIKNKVSLPAWIFKNNKFIYAVLRGLFDTDGGIYQKQKGYNRAIIEFQTKSPYIRKDIFRLLKISGFTPSKSSMNIRIQNQKELIKFFRSVGTANPKNIVRNNCFVETGQIPLNKDLKEKILKIRIKEPFKRL